MEKIASRVPTCEQLRDEKPDMERGGGQHSSPSVDTQFEPWPAGIDALRNKVAERHTAFEAPLLPRRRDPLKLRPQVEDD